MDLGPEAGDLRRVGLKRHVPRGPRRLDLGGRDDDGSGGECCRHRETAETPEGGTRGQDPAHRVQSTWAVANAPKPSVVTSPVECASRRSLSGVPRATVFCSDWPRSKMCE